MSDERKDYGPTGCVNRSFALLLVLAGLYRVVRRGR
ncbi:hypothetical protein JOF41_007303 [Saccharothrix coeruleofusca]|nr:hypothetical protein [Saccharothrix coeruleofusca]